MIFQITVTGEVLEMKPNQGGTRVRTVFGEPITFSRRPVYLEVDDLPDVLAGDKHLRIKQVDSVPEGAVVTKLKAERVQEDSTDPTDPSDPSAAPITTLKAERVQEPAAAKPKPRKR